MAANVNVGQPVWNADDIINSFTTVFCVVIYVDCICKVRLTNLRIWPIALRR